MKYFMTRFFRDSGIPADHLSALDAMIRTRNLDAGEHLIHQGEEAPNLYFIAQGLVKMFYITSNGRELVKSFLPEGSFAGSLVAQFEQCPSTFSVVCLEPVTAEAVPFSAVEALFESCPEAQAFGFRFFQMLALKKEKREFSFLCQSPEERYRAFTEENPGLSARITQGDIARYLGITPVALSRIRGRMKSDSSRDMKRNGN